MQLSIDPLRPYLWMIKAGLVAAVAIAWGWYWYDTGKDRWHDKYTAEVAAHQATKAEHAQVLAHLADLTRKAAEAAKAASAHLRAERTDNDTRYDKAVADAKQAHDDLGSALRRGTVQLQQRWTCPVSGTAAGGAAGAAGGQDGNASAREDGAADLVGDADQSDATISWLQSELIATRQAVIAAGCAVDAPP